MAGNMPVVIEGEAAAATNHAEWDDELFRSRCELPGRVPWNTLVELNKVVVRNDRWPLVENITMCDFIERYQQEEVTVLVTCCFRRLWRWLLNAEATQRTSTCSCSRVSL